MSRYTGPKNKLARKIGEDLGLKSNALKVARRLTLRPGQHGAKGRRKVSDYGVQLKEKQKMKYLYGITEKQLRRLYTEAANSTFATGEQLLSFLERRLDNVIFRLGWAPTRAAARQLVSHGHVAINTSKMTIPSYRVSVEDVITFTNKGMQIPAVTVQIKEETTAPIWLKKKQAVAKVDRLPERSDIQETVIEQLVVEFYTR